MVRRTSEIQDNLESPLGGKKENAGRIKALREEEVRWKKQKKKKRQRKS